MAIYKDEVGEKKASTSLISLSQIADGKRISKCLDIVENLDTSNDLSKYRLKSDKITAADLDDSIIDKISTGYDDTILKSKIGILESVINDKADKCDLTLFRRETDLITRYDLDDDLIKMIKSGDYDYIYDDTEVKAAIDSLRLCKTETSESGFIENLTPEFKDIVSKKFSNNVTIINALNFLFNFVNYYTTDDLRYITEVHDEIKDMGKITASVSEYLNYGKIYANTSLSI